LTEISNHKLQEYQAGSLALQLTTQITFQRQAASIEDLEHHQFLYIDIQLMQR